MLLLTLYYLVAITILVMHFTGFLERHNMEWIVLVLAASIVPALIYL
jgi:hydrogenase-4 membrane subunit HyfE